MLRLPKLSQRGAIHLIILFLLLAGIAGGVYLVNKSGFLTFKPKAASTGTRIEFFGTGVSQDKLSSISQTVNINAYYVAPSPSPTASSSAVPSTPAPSAQPSPQGPTITLNTQAPIIAGQTISVSWSGVSSPSVRDFIMVSRIGATLTRGMIFTSSCTTTPGTVAKSSGTCSNFPLSTSNISDNFQLDFYTNGALDLTNSAPFYLWATGSTPTSSSTSTPSVIINPSPIGIGGSVQGVAYAQNAGVQTTAPSSATYPTHIKLANTQAGLTQPCPTGVICTFTYTGNPTAVNNWKLTDGNGQKTVYAQFLSNNQPLEAIVSAGISFTQSPLPTPLPSSSPISDPSRGIPGDLIADIVLGHPDFNQAVPGEVVPFKVMNPGGVIVDRNASPNRIYVYDGANSRVLGYKSLGICSNNPSNVCTNQNDCGGASCNVSARKDADIIIGQAKGDYSGCNNDGNMASYPNRAPASASKLCTTVPTQNSPREGGSYSNMFVDSSNNLYITDFHNNRVLKYIDPFKTDTVADEVWGQDDFTGFRCNKADGDIASASIPNPTAQTLCMGRNTKYQESFDAGVMLDHLGNMWVSDSSNHRVLRFPKQNGIAKTADLVLGQTNFTTRSNGQGLNQLKEPSGIKESSDGKIFVADKGNNRVLVFAPPFANGQSGTTFGSQFRSPSGLEFSPENDGLWVADGGNKMLELWSLDGSEVKKVLSKDTYQPNGNCGSATQNTVCINPQPDGRCHANLCEVYGSVGIDSVGNIYATASDGFQDMVRYPAPIPSPQLGKLLSSDKRFFSPPEGSNYLSDKGLADPQGITTGGDQLIVSDGRRILFWNNYKSLSSGKAADGFVGIDSINSFQSVDPWGIGRIRADKQNRLWVMRKSTIDVYQLPLVSGAHPIKQAAISFNNPLSVLGSSQKLTWKFKEDLSGLDFDKAGNLWLAQGNPGIHRVFRIRNPFNNPTVDVILGQASPAESSCNRILALDNYDAQDNPYGAAPNTLCKPGAVRIDAVGNVWVSDYSLEFHGNRRMLEFNASQFANISNTALMGPNADLVSPTVRAWEASFDSANHMVLGYDGQLGSFFPGLYTNPLQSLKTSAAPNLTLKDFFSHGYSSTFDSDDNLYITDLNRGRVLIYKKPFLSDCRADVGRNGDVNGQDISQTVGCFGLVIGQKNASGLPCTNADVNQDGLIDQKDIQFISSKYGKKVDLKQCPNIPVPAVDSFLNLKSSATTATASFNFSYTAAAANYQVNMSTKSDMSWDVYLSFGGNKNSPVTVQNPSVKWDKYKCGATLYWQVLDSAKNIKSPIQQVIITCPDAKAKQIFVTSTIYNGNLGGLSGADAKCQTQANTAKLGGMWKAWLSDSKTAAKDRLTNYPGPYKLLNGVTVANNWRDLTDGSIQAAVNLSELKSGKNGWPWTGTNYDGNNSAWTSSSQYCNNWMSAWWWNSGIQGLTDTTGTKWSLNTSTSRCNSQSPLFCFEQ